MGLKVMIEIETLRRIRHELATLHGLWVTDRPDKFADRSSLMWQIDTKDMSGEVESVLNALDGTDTSPS